MSKRILTAIFYYLKNKRETRDRENNESGKSFRFPAKVAAIFSLCSDLSKTKISNFAIYELTINSVDFQFLLYFVF